MYKRTNEFMGGCLLGYIELSPYDLVKVFGCPSESDGYKVSGEYCFIDKNGNGFTLYDWKSTNLYDDQSAPSPSQFWASTTKYNFHIGGVNKNNINKFKQFLRKQLK